MRCVHCREALSARLDGEEAGVAFADVDAHLARCHDCQLFAAELPALHRMARVRPADPVPDLTARIIAETAPAHTPAIAPLAWWVRGGLVTLALVLLAMAVPELVAPGNASGHLAAWDVAFAAGLLFAAWQPERSRGLLPMAVVLIATMTLATYIDIRNGHPASHGLAVHLLELTGVVALWLLAHTTTPTGSIRVHRRPQPA
jgi:predicted anti-sigma-YlaC factor YlaD